MWLTTMRVNLYDLVAPLAKTVDMMDPALADHHQRVAYLAWHLAQAMDWSPDRCREIALAGILHDIGAFSALDRMALLRFEEEDSDRHALAGALLLREFEPFAAVSDIVRYHHHPFGDGSDVPEASHLLYLADRISVLIKRDAPVLAQIPGIRSHVAAGRGSRFDPIHVDAFERIAGRDVLWLEATTESADCALREALGVSGLEMNAVGLVDFAKLMCRVIDFKSEFTATHSSGVAAVAEAIALRVGFSQQECELIRIAAYLHDLGKLAIPSEILEKRGALNESERHIMRTHVFHTYRILEPIPILRQISAWSSLHQERLNGSGYPFGFEAHDIPLGARILAVADVFTALTENRPYREGMNTNETVAIIGAMAERDEQDKRVVDILVADLDVFHDLRGAAQHAAMREYDEFLDKLEGRHAAI